MLTKDHQVPGPFGLQTGGWGQPQLKTPCPRDLSSEESSSRGLSAAGAGQDGSSECGLASPGQ